jgi:hypothetical protein
LNADLPKLTNLDQNNLPRVNFSALERNQGINEYHALLIVESIKVYLEKGGNWSPSLSMSAKQKSLFVKLFNMKRDNFDKLTYWDIADLFLREYWYRTDDDDEETKSLDLIRQLNRIHYNNGPITIQNATPTNHAAMVVYLERFDTALEDYGLKEILPKTAIKWFIQEHPVKNGKPTSLFANDPFIRSYLDNGKRKSASNIQDWLLENTKKRDFLIKRVKKNLHNDFIKKRS